MPSREPGSAGNSSSWKKQGHHTRDGGVTEDHKGPMGVLSLKQVLPSGEQSVGQGQAPENELENSWVGSSQPRMYSVPQHPNLFGMKAYPIPMIERDRLRPTQGRAGSWVFCS